MKEHGKIFGDTRILVVTQDQDSKSQLKNIISRLNCSCHFVTSSEQVVSYLMDFEYDICLIDLDLKENIFDLAKLIRQEISSALPVIAFSSIVTKELIMKCFNVKINDFYTKPFDAENLHKLLLIWRHKNISTSNRQRSQS